MTAIREEELNKVNGGSIDEVAMDSVELNRKGYLSESYSKAVVILAWLYCSMKVSNAWKGTGVSCDPGFIEPNKYYYNGWEIPRDVALHHIM